MLNYQEITYYSLSDCLDYETNLQFPITGLVSPGDASDFWSAFSRLYANAAARKAFSFVNADGSAFKDPVVKLLKLVGLRYGDGYPVWVAKPCLPWVPPEVPTEADFLEKENKFLYHFFALLEASYQKFYKILDSYEALQSTLLDALKSTSKVETKFNDTPQMGGDYTSDPYMTTYTNVGGENEDMGATPMSRLDEIQRLYDGVLDRWAIQFSNMFVSEANIL